MKLLAVLGLCLVFSTVAYAEGRYCEPCIDIDEAIYPTDDYQVVTGSTIGEPNEEYSYCFCAVAQGLYTFTFCEGGGWANFDTALSVQGPDNCGPYLVCNDDWCGLQSQVDFYAPEDRTYIIVVDAWYGTGDYGLAYRGPSAPSPVEQTAWGKIKMLYH